MESSQDLEDKLSGYKDSFYQVENALKADPSNETLLKVKEDLWEVIKLTEDLLKLRRKPTLDVKEELKATHSAPAPPKEREDQGNDALKVGGKCMAVFAGDGEWYPAIVNSIADDKYTVTFVGYGDQAEVTADQIAPQAAKIPNSKRPLGEREYEYTVGPDGEVEIPKSLKILPTDSEDVRNSKKRRIHAIKYQHRLSKLEENTNTRKNAWQDFTDKVGKRKQAGFLTGRKKGSIFSSPDSIDGKVGVTGSGKGTTKSEAFFATDVVREKRKLTEALDIIKEEKSKKKESRRDHHHRK